MKAGFAALERIVADGGVDPGALHDLLSGRSDRVLDAEPPPLDPIRALARQRDIEPARDFYRFGRAAFVPYDSATTCPQGRYPWTPSGAA